jgi:hypothetical protein
MQKPISIWPAPDGDWRLPTTLIRQIHARSIMPLPRNVSKLQRHNIIQARMLELGLELGFKVQAETSTGHRKMVRTGRFDLTWTPMIAHAKRIVFELDSCWRHESLLKLGRLADSDLRLWIYYGQRPFPVEPTEPGFRKLNILRLDPADLGIRSSGRRSARLAPGEWPAMLYPRRADHGR